MWSKIFFSFLIVVLQCINFSGSKAAPREIRGVHGQLVMLETSFKALETFEKVTGAYGYKLETFAKVLEALAPAMGAIGPIFAVASMFLPKPDSAEFQAIKIGFKDTHVRFDTLEMKLNDVLDNMDKAVIYQGYKDNQDFLYNIRLKYKQFQDAPTESSSIELKESCKKNDPSETLNWIYRNIVDQQVGAQLLETVIKDVQYDVYRLKRFAQLILRDATEAGYMRQVCLTARFPNDTETREYNLKEAEKQINGIFKKLENVTEKAKIEFVERQLEKDIILLLQRENAQGMTNEDFATFLKNFLDDKYDWYVWGAHVYDEITKNEFETHNVVGDAKWVFHKFNRNVIVGYSSRSQSSLAAAEEKAKRLATSLEEKEKTYKQGKPWIGGKKEKEANCNASDILEYVNKWEEVKGRKMILVVKGGNHLYSEIESNAVSFIFPKWLVSCGVFAKDDFNVVVGF